MAMPFPLLPLAALLLLPTNATTTPQPSAPQQLRGSAPGAAPPPVPSFPKYAVSASTLTVGGFTSAGNTQTAGVWAPAPQRAGQKFPVIAFGHGWGTGGRFSAPNYSDLISAIAAHGMIVIAPESCSLNTYCTRFDQDLFRALAYAKEHANDTSSVFAHADVARLGMVGHSM